MSAASSPRSRPRLVADGGDAVEAEYACDEWEAGRLGVTARRGRNIARFGVIRQPWLRQSIKPREGPRDNR